MCKQMDQISNIYISVRLHIYTYEKIFFKIKNNIRNKREVKLKTEVP